MLGDGYFSSLEFESSFEFEFEFHVLTTITI